MMIRHLLFCIAVLAIASAQAQERPPRMGEVPADAKPDAKKDHPRPDAKPAGKSAKQPVRRRAVPMVIDRMPGPTPPAVYGPVLTVPSPAPMPATGVPGAPAPPVMINGCDAGGCNGSDGVRYNGVGTTLLSPQGRLCHRNGLAVQC